MMVRETAKVSILLRKFLEVGAIKVGGLVYGVEDFHLLLTILLYICDWAVERADW